MGSYKTYQIAKGECCTACQMVKRKRKACVSVVEERGSVIVHSALCEEHFTSGRQEASQEKLPLDILRNLFLGKGKKAKQGEVKECR